MTVTDIYIIVFFNQCLHIGYLLCISTREQVLHTLLAGRNQFFDTKTTFYVLFSHEMYKIMQKIIKKTYYKGVNHRLGVTLKCWLTPKSWSTPEENEIF